MCGTVAASKHAEGHGDRLFEAVCKFELEGIVSKRFGALNRYSTTRVIQDHPKAFWLTHISRHSRHMRYSPWRPLMESGHHGRYRVASVVHNQLAAVCRGGR